MDSLASGTAAGTATGTVDVTIASLPIPSKAKAALTATMKQLGLAPTVTAWADNEAEIGRPKGVGPASIEKLHAARRKIAEATVFEPSPHMRASSMNLATTCPASMFLGQEATRRGLNNSTVYTVVGDLGHRWMEIAVQHGRDAADSYLGSVAAPQVPVAETLAPSLHEFWDWMVENYPVVGDVYTEVPVFFPREPEVGKVAGTGHFDLVFLDGNEVEVRDWKFYNNLSFAGPMLQDLQMLVYAVAAHAMFPAAERVTVRRMLVYQCRQDDLILDRDSIEIAKEAVLEELHSVWERKELYVLGAHCTLRCFNRARCQVYQAQFKNVDTKEIKPYTGGLFRSGDDALQFLLGTKLVEARLAQGIDALKAWVEANGPISDGHGSVWGPITEYHDDITNPNAALGRLWNETDKETALGAAKTTKGAVIAGAVKFGMRPSEAKALFEAIRDSGAVAKKRVIKWMWKKVKDPRSE